MNPFLLAIIFLCAPLNRYVKCGGTCLDTASTKAGIPSRAFKSNFSEWSYSRQERGKRKESERDRSNVNNNE